MLRKFDLVVNLTYCLPCSYDFELTAPDRPAMHQSSLVTFLDKLAYSVLLDDLVVAVRQYCLESTSGSDNEIKSLYLRAE